MTVKELIKALSGCPQDAEVLVMCDFNVFVGKAENVRIDKDCLIIDVRTNENRP